MSQPSLVELLTALFDETNAPETPVKDISNWMHPGVRVRCVTDNWQKKLDAGNFIDLEAQRRFGIPENGKIYTIKEAMQHPFNPKWWGILFESLDSRGTEFESKVADCWPVRNPADLTEAWFEPVSE